MPQEHTFIAPTSRGTEALLSEELRGCGAAATREVRGAVRFRGPMEVGYRAALWSRVASRVLLSLDRFPARDAAEFYEGARRIPWREHITPRHRFAVSCVGQAPWLNNSHFGALKAKDAIVDALRQATGERPTVDRDDPELRFHVHVEEGRAELALDLAGEPLHRRGIGREAREAPLKENLAAAILLIAGWPAAAVEGRPLMDPLCGSGTLLTEAAWMARDAAPGLRRKSWGFSAWPGHDDRLWRRLRAEAAERCRAGARRPLLIQGADQDEAAVEAARANALEAGVADAVSVRRRPLDQSAPPDGAPGLLVSNPPYGVRLDDEDSLGPLYASLGDLLRQRFLGWTAWIFTGSAALGRRIGLRPARRVQLWNGPLDCRLLCFPISDRATTGQPAWRQGLG